MTTVSVPVEGADQAGEARRAAGAAASALGFDESTVGRVGIVVTEMASNLWKHAGGGQMLISRVLFEGQPCVEALALDRGPGMLDVARCFQDGYSTAGSPGSGLGAISRLSDCDLFTQPVKGTVMLARITRRKPEATSRAPFAYGGVCVPIAGEDVCGDAGSFRQAGSNLLVMLADGLGHGPSAAQFSLGAIEVFQSSRSDQPAQIVSEMHRALHGTRGGAVSLARLDPHNRTIRFAGVGNVAGMVSYGGRDSKNFVSMPGIVGHNASNVREFTYEWPTHAPVLLYSDGILSHWSLDDYQGLASHDPSLICGVVYRDKKRGRDDASVLAVRERS
jgi:anti-sigma regulatory factor (Ser/Thr protein kinase)